MFNHSKTSYKIWNGSDLHDVYTDPILKNNRLYCQPGVSDGQKSFFSTEEGHAIPVRNGDNTRWHFEYNLKDHLGNTRVTFGGSMIPGSANIVQTSSYYPFGLVMEQKNYNQLPTKQVSL